jgi:hypothetical protein
MPISANDPRYRAEYEPAQIRAMRQPLCSAYGQPNTAFGCKGNLVHYSGYHRSYNWIVNSPDSRYRLNDYSVRNSLDTAGDRNACAAFDLTPGPWGSTLNRRRMREITGRVHAAAKARDPRLRALREFAGTLDGRTVVAFNCSDGSFKSPFDSSHLDHVHGSFWRSRAGWDHTGIINIILGDDDQMDHWTDPTVRTAAQRTDAIRSMDEEYQVDWGSGPQNETNQLAKTLRAIEAKLATGPVVLSDAQLETVATKVAALLEPKLRSILDEELDEQSRAGADVDPPV